MLTCEPTMPQPFPISRPRDLLDKAKRELDLLEGAASGFFGRPDATLIADLTINTAWSLWHVTDWIGHGAPEVVKDVVPRQMKKPARKRTDAFQKRVRALSPDLRICWAFSLHFKHFELEQNSPAKSVFKSAHVSSSVVGFTETAPTMSDVPANFSLGAMSSAVGDFVGTLHPKVSYRGQRLRLTDVYRHAHDYLDQLLKNRGL